MPRGIHMCASSHWKTIQSTLRGRLLRFGRCGPSFGPILGRGKCGNEGFPVMNFGVKKIQKRTHHNSQPPEPPQLLGLLRSSLKSDRGHHRLALAALCYGSNAAQDEPVVWSTRRHRRPSRVAGFLPHISRFTSLCRTGASVQLSSCVLQRRGHPPDAAVGC